MGDNMVMSRIRDFVGDKQKRTKTLSARVSEELHRRVDVYTAQRGLTMTQFFVEAIEEKLSREEGKLEVTPSQT